MSAPGDKTSNQHEESKDSKKTSIPVPSDEDVDAHVQEHTTEENEITPEIAASRLVALKLAEEKKKAQSSQFNAQLAFMSENVDEDGELEEVETGYESLEEEDEGFLTGVLLGYLEDPVHKYSLRRDYFPSKAGGRPAWLNPKDLPEIKCKHCDSQMKFLIQLYSPLPASAAHADAFHRAIFVFCCSDQSCFMTNNSVLVYRNQLPRNNPYYSADPPVDEAEAVPSPDVASPDVLPFEDVSLCAVCGAKATTKCGECTTHYCSEEHMKLDEVAGHQKICGKHTAADVATVKRNRALLTFPAFSIETEEEYVDGDFNVTTHREHTMIEEYHDSVKRMTPKERAEDEEAFQSMFGGMGKKNQGQTAEDGLALTKDEDNADQLFIDFQARTSYNPEQVIRYIPYHRRQRALASEGKPAPAPLWANIKRRLPTKAVPPCACGAARVFEFQIMPQLLYFFEQEDSEKRKGVKKIPRGFSEDFDFGTVCVYTCGNNCGSGQYTEEFGYAQPPNE